MACMDSPVLVTGASGFAGSYVVRALRDRGREVVAFDIADWRSESRYVVGDGVDEIPFERGSTDHWPTIADVINRYRPASIVHMGMNMNLVDLSERPLVALKTSVEGTVNLFEAARQADVKRTIITSSVGVIGRVCYEPIDASHPTVVSDAGPEGGYGAAKLACEAFAHAYCQEHGLDVRIIRPSAIYGFGMSWNAPNYAKQIVEPAVLGEPVRLATGGPVPRDYIAVSDLANLAVALLEGPDEADRTFYAATGRPLRTGGDMGRIVSELVPGAKIEIGEEFSEDDKKELACRGRISIDNARDQLGWELKHAELEDGVANYIKTFRDFLDSGGIPTPKPAGLRAPGSG